MCNCETQLMIYARKAGEVMSELNYKRKLWYRTYLEFWWCSGWFDTHQIIGFIGLTDNYIAGIFVKEAAQSKGIGKQLLNYVKEFKSVLSLSVYQKNMRAISFYQREKFTIQSENMDDCTNEKEFIMNWSK